MEEVGAADQSVDQGGCILPDLGPDLLGGGSVRHSLRVGDVGHDTVYWEGFGNITPQGGPKADEKATFERTGWSKGLPPSGEGNGGDRTAGGGDLCIPPPEHSRKVYYNQACYGLVSISES